MYIITLHMTAFHPIYERLWKMPLYQFFVLFFSNTRAPTYISMSAQAYVTVIFRLIWAEQPEFLYLKLLINSWWTQSGINYEVIISSNNDCKMDACWGHCLKKQSIQRVGVMLDYVKLGQVIIQQVVQSFQRVGVMLDYVKLGQVIIQHKYHTLIL